MAGYYHERGADGVLDPLFSKAMVIESGGERAAFVALDIISVTRGDHRPGPRRDREGHRHQGRPRDDQRHARAHRTGAGRTAASAAATWAARSQLAVDYTEGLPAKIAESVRLANERLQPAQLSAAQGRCEDLTFNRRYFMRDGTRGLESRAS